MNKTDTDKPCPYCGGMERPCSDACTVTFRVTLPPTKRGSRPKGARA